MWNLVRVISFNIDIAYKTQEKTQKIGKLWVRGEAKEESSPQIHTHSNTKFFFALLWLLLHRERNIEFNQIQPIFDVKFHTRTQKFRRENGGDDKWGRKNVKNLMWNKQNLISNLCKKKSEELKKKLKKKKKVCEFEEKNTQKKGRKSSNEKWIWVEICEF